MEQNQSVIDSFNADKYIDFSCSYWKILSKNKHKCTGPWNVQETFNKRLFTFYRVFFTLFVAYFKICLGLLWNQRVLEYEFHKWLLVLWFNGCDWIDSGLIYGINAYSNLDLACILFWVLFNVSKWKLRIRRT